MKLLAVITIFLYSLLVSCGGTAQGYESPNSVVYCKDVASCKAACDTDTFQQDCSGMMGTAKATCEVDNEARLRSCYYERID